MSLKEKLRLSEEKPPAIQAKIEDLTTLTAAQLNKKCKKALLAIKRTHSIFYKLTAAGDDLVRASGVAGLDDWIADYFVARYEQRLNALNAAIEKARGLIADYPQVASAVADEAEEKPELTFIWPLELIALRSDDGSYLIFTSTSDGQPLKARLNKN